MDGDRLGPEGGVYTATVTLSDGGTRTDSNWYAGKPSRCGGSAPRPLPAHAVCIGMQVR